MNDNDADSMEQFLRGEAAGGLRDMLSTMQIETGGFEVTFDNLAKGVDMTKMKLVETDVDAKAVSLFRKERPDYDVRNLLSNQRTSKVMEEMASQIDKDRVILSTGCCTAPKCPVTAFLRCVLQELAWMEDEG